MDILIGLLIVCVLVSICAVPVILTALLFMMRKMYLDWKKYREQNV